MIPFILGALAAVGLSELSKRNKPKMADGGGVGSYKNEGLYAKGGGVGYTEQFEEVADFGNEQYYIRKWGKVSTDKKDNVELLAVANIKDLEDYMSEEELQKEGNFQLDITLVPIEKHISKKHKSSANDDSVSMGGNTIVNIVNYMGGLNYEPQEKVFFKTFDEAHKYLMSKQLNDKISSQGMSGFILDKAYNRIGQTNWDYLYYMMGETERFAKGGGVGKSKKDYVAFLNGMEVPEHDHPENGGRVSWRFVNRYGEWLRKNDPIAFEVGYREWVRN